MTLPFNTQAGLASARIRLGGPTEDTDGGGGGRYRCQGCGQMVPLSHTCTPPTPAAVLAGAFPWHPQMDVWAAEDRARDDVFARYRRNGGRIVPATLPGKAVA